VDSYFLFLTLSIKNIVYYETKNILRRYFMNTEIKNLLEGEIIVELENLSNMDDVEKQKGVIENIEKLYRLKLEENRLSIDLKKHNKEDKESKLDRGLKYGFMALELLVPIVAYTIWYRIGLRFEETGTITSPMTRNLLSKMFPKKA
jgi:hypothetical protein